VIASVVHLTVRDDNLVVAVQVSDWRGPGLVDPDQDRARADALVDAVPETVPKR
jgi:hypothetical protein